LTKDEQDFDSKEHKHNKNDSSIKVNTPQRRNHILKSLREEEEREDTALDGIYIIYIFF
jgi:hypothetical protein